MLWGFFKKMVVADNCAAIVNQHWNEYQGLPTATLLLLGVMFAFQIYCDFSGYSDIAIGCARLFGFELKQNFNFPYFSRSIPEFWRVGIYLSQLGSEITFIFRLEAAAVPRQKSFATCSLYGR